MRTVFGILRKFSSYFLFLALFLCEKFIFFLFISHMRKTFLCSLFPLEKIFLSPSLFSHDKNTNSLSRIPDEMRPIKLKKIVLGYESHSNETYFRFDMNLNYQLANVITRFSDGKPTLIFCSTRRGVEMAANVLLTDLPLNLNPEQQQAIFEISNQIIDNKLRVAISKGIAYHHAGLAINDRTLVENGFRKGQIPVLLCTSTLAMGINLPAHLVIIKSTQSYQQGNADEISQNTILQMIGRAGRPQFDTSGVAVIMTQQQKKVSEHFFFNNLFLFFFFNYHPYITGKLFCVFFFFF